MPTWQLSSLPSRPHHCRCTPTDALPFLGKAEGSKTSTPSDSPNCVQTCRASSARRGRSYQGEDTVEVVTGFVILSATISVFRGVCEIRQVGHPSITGLRWTAVLTGNAGTVDDPARVWHDLGGGYLHLPPACSSG